MTNTAEAALFYPAGGRNSTSLADSFAFRIAARPARKNQLRLRNVVSRVDLWKPKFWIEKRIVGSPRDSFCVFSLRDEV